MSARIPLETQMQTSPDFLCMLPAAAAQFSLAALRYVMCFRFCGLRPFCLLLARFGSRAVPAMDSGAVGPRFKSLRQTVHTHRASVHQTATLAVAILTVSGVTAGLK